MNSLLPAKFRETLEAALNRPLPLPIELAFLAVACAGVLLALKRMEEASSK